MAKQQRQWSALILCSLSHSNAQPARQQSLGRDRIDVPSRAVGPRDVSHPCAAQPITIAIDFGLASLARSMSSACSSFPLDPARPDQILTGPQHQGW